MHIHNRKLDELEASSDESGVTEDIREIEERKASHKPNLLKNWPLMSTIIVYCVFSLQEIAYSEVS